jgi:hypothetical protein
MKQINSLLGRFLMMAGLLAGSLFVVSCKDEESTPDPVLAITGVSPGSGNAGTVVTITGTGFDATASNNTVKFGATNATVLAATPTTLVTQVPAGITGNQALVVGNTPKGTTATSATQFNVTTVIGKEIVTVNAPITASTTWTANRIYVLSNYVYVRSGVTLTIEPGTIIKGDKITRGTLIFEPGSVVNAVGTAANPIVFTSNLGPGLRALGDWGGVVITGKADHNGLNGITDPTRLPTIEGGPATQFGAIDGQRSNADNSGKFQYVRIEYAGVPLSPNNEINGLSLYAVGSGTTIDHVQVSYANDDSFEWFGGAVNAKYLIAYRGIDDDFDTDNGFSGSVQFGLGVRDLTSADQSGSKAFESDNDAAGSTNQPQTSVVFSNMTLVGPTATAASSNTATPTVNAVAAIPSANPSASAPSANYVSAIHIRRNSALSLFNSVVLGWPAGILLDGTNVAANIAAGRSVIANNIIGGTLTGTIGTATNQNRDILYIPGAGGAGSLTPINSLGPDSTAFGAAVGPVTYLRANNNRRIRTTTEFLLTDAFLFPSPNVLPAANSAALTGASFGNAKLGAFFDKTVTFVGAVGAAANDFTKEAWVNFNPNATVYQ